MRVSNSQPCGNRFENRGIAVDNDISNPMMTYYKYNNEKTGGNGTNLANCPFALVPIFPIKLAPTNIDQKINQKDKGPNRVFDFLGREILGPFETEADFDKLKSGFYLIKNTVESKILRK